MNLKKIALLAFFIVSAALFYYLDLHRLLTLSALRDYRALLVELYRTRPFVTVLTFILVYALQTALFLPADVFLSLLSGALFGVVTGAVFTNIGATLGATVGFLAVRYVFHDFVQKRFGPKLEPVNKALGQSGLRYIIGLRLVPLFPFVLITMAAAVTRISLKNFTLGTMLGIIPGSILYCNAGASLAVISSRSDILTPRVIISLSLLCLFSLLPLLYRKTKRQRSENERQ